MRFEAGIGPFDGDDLPPVSDAVGDDVFGRAAEAREALPVAVLVAEGHVRAGWHLVLPGADDEHTVAHAPGQRDQCANHERAHLIRRSTARPPVSSRLYGQWIWDLRLSSAGLWAHDPYMTTNTKPPVGLSVWEHDLYEHLTEHMQNELRRRSLRGARGECGGHVLPREAHHGGRGAPPVVRRVANALQSNAEFREVERKCRT